MLRRFVLVLIAFVGCADAYATLPAKPPTPLDPPPAQAIETASGLSYVVLKAAPAGARSVSADYVQYRATIWSADGVTRANAKEDGPQTVAIKELIQRSPGLARAVLTTPIGETRRWWIDADKLRPGYPGMPDLRHVVDLTVVGNADPVPAPADVAAVPANATVTGSGLAYRVLKKGTGRGHPSPDSLIEIDYSGWTTDGRLFDSSVLRKERAKFPLDGLIPGWKEGLLLMSPGDTFRFWIPGQLAYDSLNLPDTPKGMLVFDVTLYDFSSPGPNPPVDH